MDWQTEADGHFTAMASYSGSATSSYVKGYTVTADYTGTVSRINLNKIRYVAIFEGTALDTALSASADQTYPTGQEIQAREKSSVLPVVAVVAAVIPARMLVTVGTRPRNVSLAAMPADDFSPEQVCNVGNVFACVAVKASRFCVYSNISCVMMGGKILSYT